MLQHNLLASLLRCYHEPETPRNVCTQILGTFWGLTRTSECRAAVVASGAIEAMLLPILTDTNEETVQGLDNRVLCVLALAHLRRATPEASVCSKSVQYSVDTVVTILR